MDDQTTNGANKEEREIGAVSDKSILGPNSFENPKFISISISFHFYMRKCVMKIIKIHLA